MTEVQLRKFILNKLNKCGFDSYCYVEVIHCYHEIEIKRFEKNDANTQNSELKKDVFKGIPNIFVI